MTIEDRLTGCTSDQRELVKLYEEIIAIAAWLPEPERAELRAWEAEHVDGSGAYGTSDWPGWRRHLSYELLDVLNRKQVGRGR
jgi:hypothetical protein